MQQRLREQLEKSAEMLKRAAIEGAMQTLKDEAKEIADQGARARRLGSRTRRRRTSSSPPTRSSESQTGDKKLQRRR